MSEEADQLPNGFDRRLLLPMVLGAVLNPLNTSIIAVSLVPIGRAFGTPSSQTLWLVSALYVATAIGQPVAGRLLDTFGSRTLFLSATVFTAAAGLIGSIAPAFWVLVLARVILGLGTCTGYPTAMTLIRAEAERTGQDNPTSVLTILTVSSQTIAVVGPTLGGALVGLGGWRASFAINIPLAAGAFAAGFRRLPRSGTVRKQRGFDTVGVLLFAAFLVAGMAFLLYLHVHSLWLLGIAGFSLVAFVLRETRTAEPFLDLRVLSGNAALVRTYIRMLLTGTITYTVLYGYSQWLEDGRGLSASSSGLLLLPLFVMALATSAYFGGKPQIRVKLMVGAGFQVGAALVLLALGTRAPIWLLVVFALVVGVPQGLNNLAIQHALYLQATPASLGASSGLLRTALYVGAMVASAVTGMFFGSSADTAGLHGLGWFILGVALVFLVLTALDRSLPAAGG